MAEYIEREDAIDTVLDAYFNTPKVNLKGELFYRGLLKIPAADVVPVVHGHFVHDGPRFAHGVDWWHCSNCGKLVSGVETRFNCCSNCGVRMYGGAGNETD